MRVLSRDVGETVTTFDSYKDNHLEWKRVGRELEEGKGGVP